MRKYDYFWASNKEWYHRDEYDNPIIHDDAPKEVKESFEHYLKQREHAAEQIKKGLSMD